MGHHRERDLLGLLRKAPFTLKELEQDREPESGWPPLGPYQQLLRG
jgi:hypothetical protein